jgi:hypothetical protein
MLIHKGSEWFFLKAIYPFVDNKVVIITELREEGRP